MSSVGTTEGSTHIPGGPLAVFMMMVVSGEFYFFSNSYCLWSVGKEIPWPVAKWGAAAYFSP